MSLSLAQQKAIALVPKFTGAASCIGSSIIVLTIARDHKRRSSPYHRLILGTSISDLLASFWVFMSTWPFPRESGAVWAVGTTQSCSAQGFFMMLSLASPVYNASLSIYYVLVIVYGWKPERIKAIEPYLHISPILWALGVAIACLPVNLYNPAIYVCHLITFPKGCQGDECIRGLNANIYVWVFFYGPIWAMIAIVTVSVARIFAHVRQIGKASESHTFRASSQTTTARSKIKKSANLRRTKQVARQCFGYAAAFYLCWLPTTVMRIMLEVSGRLGFAAILISTLTTPLQGLPNFIVYLAPRFRRYRRKHPNAGVWNWFRAAASPEEEAITSEVPLRSTRLSSTVSTRSVMFDEV